MLYAISPLQYLQDSSISSIKVKIECIDPTNRFLANPFATLDRLVASVKSMAEFVDNDK